MTGAKAKRPATRVALLTSDGRELWDQYEKPEMQLGTAPAALIQGLSGESDVEVHVISCAQRPIPFPKKLGERVFVHGLYVPRLGWLRTGYAGCIRAVRACLRGIAPDIVHAQGTERDCGICGVFSGLPNVLTIHGNMRRIARVNRARPLSFLWMQAQFERFVLPRTDGVVCITSHTEHAVRSLARRTWRVPNPVDETFFGVERAPTDPPVILCIASVCLLKNQNQLIRALDPLAAERRFRLLFAGSVASDAYGREFESLLSERAWCTHVGLMDRAQIKSLLAGASLLVLPSLEENCPMVVLEAAAAGVPVVAARVGGVPDLIEEDVTGLLCDPRDGPDLCRRVRELLSDPGKANALAERGKAVAQARFRPSVIARQHLDIYDQVLSTFS